MLVLLRDVLSGAHFLWQII